jgi:hypothetical protein
MLKVPASGWSIPASMLSSVDLPDPDGPMTATKSPRGMVRSSPEKMGIISPPMRYAFRTPLSAI